MQKHLLPRIHSCGGEVEICFRGVRVAIHTSVLMSSKPFLFGSHVMLTITKLGEVRGTSLPQNIGTLTTGASNVRAVTFSGAPKWLYYAADRRRFTDSSFNSTRKVTAPGCTNTQALFLCAFPPPLPERLEQVA